MVENRTGPQTIEFLTKRVVALGAVQTGQFLVDCDTFMSVPAVGKSLCRFYSTINIIISLQFNTNVYTCLKPHRSIYEVEVRFANSPFDVIHFSHV
jgi:hypothetical protein